MANRLEQATDGLDVTVSAQVVEVRDGADRWLCTRAAWDAGCARLETQAPYPAGESRHEAAAAAYEDLVHAVGAESGPIISRIGSDSGTVDEKRELARAALAAEMMEIPEARRYGVLPDAASCEVSDYETSDTLPGLPTEQLVRESLAAGSEGAVSAYRAQDGRWEWLDASRVAEYRRTGEDVRTVYVTE